MTSEVAFCPRCGTARIAGMRFCAKCGADLEIRMPTSGPVAPETARVFETIEVIDRDTGEMPVVANLVGGALGGSTLIRHFLIAIHRWPGGSEEIPIYEYGVSAGETPETMRDRAQVQTGLDDFGRDLAKDGWEAQPRGSVWFSRTFRREIQPGEEAGPIAGPQAVAEMERIQTKAAERARQLTRPMGTSLGLGSLVFWIVAVVLINVVSGYIAFYQPALRGTAQLLLLGALIWWRVNAYKAWKRDQGGQ